MKMLFPDKYIHVDLGVFIFDYSFPNSLGREKEMFKRIKLTL
jgi:hypothetical protein